MAQTVKDLPAMQETQVRSLGQEKSPGEGYGYPFQHSSLENPVDRGAWWAKAMGSQESETTERLTPALYTKRHSFISDELSLLLSHPK